MAKNVHIRDVPDDVHQELTRRAAAERMSLRQYLIDVLADHCSRPTVDEWLEGLERLSPVKLRTSGAEAVAEARAEEDRAETDAGGD
ncbi:MAG: FitA-like ribbon-helix-helix domain-containing protein [Acidimicrobiia bacterium]